MHGTDTPETEPGDAEVQFGPDQLGRDEYTHAHAENAPEKGGEGEAANNLVVVEVGCCGGNRTGHLGSVVLQVCERLPPVAKGEGGDRNEHREEWDSRLHRREPEQSAEPE
ncbi:hypothetical protein D9M69_642470 [compost metagenome]